MVRWLSCLLVVSLVALIAPRPAFALDDVSVADSIAKLSDPDAAVRERASAALWSAGKSAEPALRQALGSDDPEVVRRARCILFQFQLGLYPDTPAQILDLVQKYRAGDGAARQVAINGLANQGNRGFRVLLGLRRSERDDRWRGAILRAIGARPHERQGAAMILAEGDAVNAIEVLKTAAEDGEAATRDWAALLLLRGDLDAAIATTRTEAKNSPDGRPATRLAYLARARGDLGTAATAADEADDPHLVDSILIEAADWTRLSMRYRERVGSTSDTLGFATAFYRLAGQKEGVETAAAALRNFADHHDDEYLNCSECLMLNDRVDEGVAVLLSHKNYLTTVDFLLSRLQFKEAMALPAKAAADLKPADLLQLRAKVIAAYRFTGDSAAAEKERLAVAIANAKEKDFTTWLLLADDARQAGKSDEADRFLAAAMELQAAGEGAPVLDKAGLPDGFASLFWWRLLRVEHVSESYEQTIKRLRGFANGTLATTEMDALLATADKRAATQSPADQEKWLETFAQTLEFFGRHEQSEKVYRKIAESFPSFTSLQHVGDCEAARGDFSRAASTYEQAWELDRTRPVPLALRGWALLKAGDTKEARAAIDLAHALPLGDETQRSTLEETFRKHGLDDEARRERELILKTGSFLSWDVCNANRLCGDDANTRGDFISAANYWEKAFLGNLQTSTSFLEPWANVMIPVMIHRTRALGLIKQSAKAALAEAKIAMTDSPGDANTLIDLVTGFEQAGHKAEADSLFTPAATAYTSLCEEFPQSGSAHNQLAWVEARCHRNLDDALKHGLRAVELDPKNTADIDTLAEVYFERAEYDRAIEAMTKCVELEPNIARHKEQIARFKAARAGKK